MWEEIQDSPGEIYDMEDFYKQVEELREIMDKCIELEEQEMITIHNIRTGEILLEGIEDTLRVMSGVDYTVDKYDPRNVENTAAYSIGYSQSSLRLIQVRLSHE